MIRRVSDEEFGDADGPLDEDIDWEHLLILVKDQRVVPIVGRDLLRLDVDGQETLLDSFLALELAHMLRLSPQLLAGGDPLQTVAEEYIVRGYRPNLYSRIKTLLKNRPFGIPRLLRQLAEITDFDLFVTTTFDSLLVKTIDDVRFGGRPRTTSISVRPKGHPQDLAPEWSRGSESVVFRLFGDANSASPEYAVTEEDMLEFVYKLQDEHWRPNRLFDVLNESYLLFLGCGFPDWLSRFFVRTVRNERLVEQRDVTATVADGVERADARLMSFFDHHKTKVFKEGVGKFVDELHRRWLRQKSGDAQLRVAVRDVSDKPSPFPEGAIFLSYAREDRGVARLVMNRLEGAGLDVWFDKKNIPAGDDWEHLIRENIERCYLFVPIISRHAVARDEGYFYQEWRFALDRALRMAPGVVFIIPIVIDDTDMSNPRIPPEFNSVNWVELSDGDLTPEFLAHVRTEVRKRRAPAYFPHTRGTATTARVQEA